MPMTKEEILERLKSSNEVNVMDDTRNWKDAFDLYFKATGVRMRTEDRCNKCFNKVLDWLQGVQ